MWYLCQVQRINEADAIDYRLENCVWFLGYQCMYYVRCLFLPLQKCERLLLHLFCSDLSSDFQEPVSPSVSLEAWLTTDEKFAGLMSHGVTVTVILMMRNVQYLSVKTEKL